MRVHRLLVVLCLVAGCGDSNHLTSDAGGPDGSLDARTDAGVDAPVDASTSSGLAVTYDDGAAVTAISFSFTPLGEVSATNLHVTNTGAAATGPITLSITGTDASDFALVGGDTTCASGLAPGASCAVELTFTPSSTGLRSATLTIATATDGVTIALAGQAFISSFGLSPSSVTFGQVQIGALATATVTVTNNASTDAPIDDITVSGTDYSLGISTCGTTLAAGASCDVIVQLTPSQLGDRTGSLVVASVGITYTAALDGHGARLITVTRNGTGNGTVTSSPSGIACGATCSGLFETSVVLTATPDAISTFSGFSGGPCTTSPCTIAAGTSLVSLTATFTPSGTGGIEVQFAGGGLGQVSVNGTWCSADCAIPMAPGTSVNVEADAVYGGAMLSGACTGSGQCTFSQPGGVATLTVTITKNAKERWTRLFTQQFHAMAYDGSGNLLILGDNLTKLAPDGSVVWTIPSGSWWLVATGPSDSIYLDSGDSIDKLDASGAPVWAVATSFGVNNCITPGCFAVGAEGTVATDTANTLTWWSADGTTTWTTPLPDSNGGTGVAIDHTGVVSVALENDSLDGYTVAQFDSTGTRLADPGIAIPESYPKLACTVDDHVIATSSGQNEEFLTMPSGTTTRMAMSNGDDGIATAPSGSTDGAWFFRLGGPPAAAALRVGGSPLEIDYPNGVSAVAIDSAGNLATLSTFDEDDATPVTVVQTFAQ